MFTVTVRIISALIKEPCRFSSILGFIVIRLEHYNANIQATQNIFSIVKAGFIL